MGADLLLQVLDVARWAPSGDNTQPWRFEIAADDHLIVHGFDTRDHCVYDLDGFPSQLAHGALLENIRIASSAHRLRTEAIRRADTPEAHLLFDVTFHPDPSVSPDSLNPAMLERVTQRRAMRTVPLTASQKSCLETAVGCGYRVLWFESLAERWQVTRLLFSNAKIRLTCREAFDVHRSIIEWNSNTSEDKIPDRALGLDAVTLRLMRKAMEKWERVDFLNTYLGGTLLPRLELDVAPGLMCAAHFVIASRAPLNGLDDRTEAGRAMQRFWLTAAHQGLCVQPEMTPLVFSRYVGAGLRFSKQAEPWRMAECLAASFKDLLGSDILPDRAIFMGRIGAGPSPTARSTRLPVSRLLYTA